MPESQPAPEFTAGGDVKFYTVLYSCRKRGQADFRMQGHAGSGKVYSSPQEAIEQAKKWSIASDGTVTYYVAEVFLGVQRPAPQAEVVELK